ncbi:class I SAM-dependent methyltransferase [Streptomyces sp. HK10]|uniref:class I SAM-dependent methyltransferase n=1 Tax=Streptomyces sp. HK10 TaxID=3373255 RepID=UPI003748C3FD
MTTLASSPSPADLPPTQAPDLNAGTHTSRLAQQRILTDPHDTDAWRTLTTTYADQAPIWKAWSGTQHGYDWPVRAGLARTRPAPWALELCCGTGEATTALAQAIPAVVATDINTEMLTRCGDLTGVRWRNADVRFLPYADHTVPLVVALNGVFFAPELRRVTASAGQVLWCTSFGPGTPLYVAPEQLHQAIGADWHMASGQAGHGQWILLTAPAY